MATGLRGTFVISSCQTEVDGLKQGAGFSPVIGSVWRWSGRAVCVDGSRDLLLLGEQLSQGEVRRRAGRRLRQVLADVVPPVSEEGAFADDMPADGGFVVTDGQSSYAASIIQLPGAAKTLLVFADRVPAADRDHWVVEVARPERAPVAMSGRPAGLVCFGAGAMISTPNGKRPVETLQPGDRVETRDDGPQPVVWAGYTEINPARVATRPEVRPVRIAAGAFGSAPGDALILSPDHRVLVAGSAARALYNADEVLVAARSLVDDRRVRQIRPTSAVRYHHIMLERHQVIWAGGLACESFHPGDADLLALPDAQRLALLEVAPDVYRDPDLFGDHARRVLTPAEAAILAGGQG